MADATTFWALVAKVQTMADGGKRVYLDLPEDATLAAAEMMEYQRLGAVLDVTMTARERDGGDGDEQPRQIHI